MTNVRDLIEQPRGWYSKRYDDATGEWTIVRVYADPDEARRARRQRFGLFDRTKISCWRHEPTDGAAAATGG